MNPITSAIVPTTTLPPSVNAQVIQTNWPPFVRSRCNHTLKSAPKRGGRHTDYFLHLSPCHDISTRFRPQRTGETTHQMKYTPVTQRFQKPWVYTTIRSTYEIPVISKSRTLDSTTSTQKRQATAAPPTKVKCLDIPITNVGPPHYHHLGAVNKYFSVAVARRNLHDNTIPAPLVPWYARARTC